MKTDIQIKDGNIIIVTDYTYEMTPDKLAKAIKNTAEWLGVLIKAKKKLDESFNASRQI